MSNQNFQSTRRNLRLVMLESAITAGLLAMPIMTPFFKSIGMTQADISLSQAIYTLVVSLINFPAGWLADRFSRKWANIIGDFGVFMTFLIYSQANDFLSVVCCEVALGFFMALSQGVDMALLKHFAERLMQTNQPQQRLRANISLRRVFAVSRKNHEAAPQSTHSSASRNTFFFYSAQLSLWQHVCTILILLLGGPIGAISFRLAIALSGVSYLIGAICSYLIQDDSPKLQPVHRNPIRDMGRVIRVALNRPRLRIRLIAYAVGREMTHSIIWVFTPLLLAVGVPLQFTAFAWVVNNLCCIFGAKLAVKWTNRLTPQQKLLLPVILMGLSMGTLTVALNICTIWLYGLMGVVRGWTGATLLPLIEEETPPTEQASVVSLAKVLGQLIYIPTTMLVGVMADYNLRLATLTTLLLFFPAGILVSWGLGREK